MEVHAIKESIYKSYDELPLFLNAKIVSDLLGISKSKCYEMFCEGELPALKLGGRILVPKEKFISWVEEKSLVGDAK